MSTTNAVLVDSISFHFISIQGFAVEAARWDSTALPAFFRTPVYRLQPWKWQVVPLAPRGSLTFLVLRPQPRSYRLGVPPRSLLLRGGGVSQATAAHRLSGVHPT